MIFMLPLEWSLFFNRQIANQLFFPNWSSWKVYKVRKNWVEEEISQYYQVRTEDGATTAVPFLKITLPKSHWCRWAFQNGVTILQTKHNLWFEHIPSATSLRREVWFNNIWNVWSIQLQYIWESACCGLLSVCFQILCLATSGLKHLRIRSVIKDIYLTKLESISPHELFSSSRNIASSCVHPSSDRHDFNFQGATLICGLTECETRYLAMRHL